MIMRTVRLFRQHNASRETETETERAQQEARNLLVRHADAADKGRCLLSMMAGHPDLTIDLDDKVAAYSGEKVSPEYLERSKRSYLLALRILEREQSDTDTDALSADDDDS